jgi:hypothetical protein
MTVALLLDAIVIALLAKPARKLTFLAISPSVAKLRAGSVKAQQLTGKRTCIQAGSRAEEFALFRGNASRCSTFTRFRPPLFAT